MKFDLSKINLAISLQRKSYQLLKWVSQTVQNNVLPFHAANDALSLPEISEKWVEDNYDLIPKDCRPDRKDIKEFSNLFSTYLESSFDLDQSPKKILFSPGNHCFCPLCSWLINSPNLKKKKVFGGDREKALLLKKDTLETIIQDLDLSLPESEKISILKSESLFEEISVITYVNELFLRMKGFSNGAATLVLWRGFAYTRTGAPKKDFILNSEIVVSAYEKIKKLINMKSKNDTKPA